MFRCLRAVFCIRNNKYIYKPWNGLDRTEIHSNGNLYSSTDDVYCISYSTISHAYAKPVYDLIETDQQQTEDGDYDSYTFNEDTFPSDGAVSFGDNVDDTVGSMATLEQLGEEHQTDVKRQEEAMATTDDVHEIENLKLATSDMTTDDVHETENLKPVTSDMTTDELPPRLPQRPPRMIDTKDYNEEDQEDTDESEQHIQFLPNINWASEEFEEYTEVNIVSAAKNPDEEHQTEVKTPVAAMATSDDGEQTLVKRHQADRVTPVNELEHALDDFSPILFSSGGTVSLVGDGVDAGSSMTNEQHSENVHQTEAKRPVTAITTTGVVEETVITRQEVVMVMAGAVEVKRQQAVDEDDTELKRPARETAMADLFQPTTEEILPLSSDGFDPRASDDSLSLSSNYQAQ